MSYIREVLRTNEACPPPSHTHTLFFTSYLICAQIHCIFLSLSLSLSLRHTHTHTLTGCHLEALEFDRFDVVDESRHLLCGVHLTAGCALREADNTNPSISPSASQTHRQPRYWWLLPRQSWAFSAPSSVRPPRPPRSLLHLLLGCNKNNLYRFHAMLAPFLIIHSILLQTHLRTCEAPSLWPSSRPASPPRWTGADFRNCHSKDSLHRQQQTTSFNLVLWNLLVFAHIRVAKCLCQPHFKLVRARPDVAISRYAILA